MAIRSLVVVGIVALWSVFGARADLLVADSWRDGVHIVSSYDGTITHLDFISDTHGGPDLSKPVEAMVVGGEIWMTDQNGDGVFRYDMTGAYVGMFVGPADRLDNVRGFHVQDNVLYVTNFGTANGAPGSAIRTFDATTGTDLGSLDPPITRSLWDVAPYGARILASDDLQISTNPFSNTAAIWELLGGGVFGTFATGSQGSNGISLIKQMVGLSNGNLLAANNSLPRALIEFDPSGAIVASYPLDTLQANGVYELENGQILIAAQGTGVLGTNGLYTLDRDTGVVTPIITGAELPGGMTPEFINFIVPEPATAGAVLVLLGLAGRRRG